MTSLFSFRQRVEPHPEDGIIRDYRQRLADEQMERAERRRLELESQRSELSDARARIQMWEKVHGLRLPTSPTHPVLQVIATATDLTLNEILEEQRQRSASTR
jgi:hypothetical protein